MFSRTIRCQRRADTLVAVFAYYFMGLVISRIGSLMIEPTLKKVGFLKSADYSKFVLASKTDNKLDVLSETNNMYRTLCALSAQSCSNRWPLIG